MKTVYLTRDFDYQADSRRSIRFQSGTTYRRVLEAAAHKIVAAGAGRIVEQDEATNNRQTVDARHAFTPRNKRR